MEWKFIEDRKLFHVLLVSENMCTNIPLEALRETAGIVYRVGAVLSKSAVKHQCWVSHELLFLVFYQLEDPMLWFSYVCRVGFFFPYITSHTLMELHAHILSCF
jgi:hypothetical protein